MPESTRRRDFVRALALGGASAALPLSARGQEPPKDDAPKPRTEADARMDLILARYGTSLDEAGKKAVRAEIEMIVRRAESLRKFPLTNGDEPMPVFAPYRAPLS